MSEWRSVVGFEGFYEVHPSGKVRRVGRARGARVGLVLRPFPSRFGYLSLRLCRGNFHTAKLLHVLVAAAFIGPKPPKHQINHRDGVKAHNNVENLEYVTASQNMRHAYANDLNRGPGRRLSFSQIDELRASNAPYRELAEQFGVSLTTAWILRNAPLSRKYMSNRPVGSVPMSLTVRELGVVVAGEPTPPSRSTTSCPR